MRRIESKWLIIGVLAAAAVSMLHPDLTSSSSGSGGAAEFRRFFFAAATPTMYSEGVQPLPLMPAIKDAIRHTLTIAMAAMSLAILMGLIVGVLASRAVWESDSAVYESKFSQFCHHVLGPFLRGSLRFALAVFRSVHELVWALIFCGLFGVNSLSGIFALAVPYAATLGRLYAEILDETPRAAALAIRTAGAGSLQVLTLGLLPRAAPQILSYTFYRFDCAIRSSAVLGFVGLPTLGLEVRSAFNYDHYREVWTWLYVLFALLVVFELLGGVVRRRLQP